MTEKKTTFRKRNEPRPKEEQSPYSPKWRKIRLLHLREHPLCSVCEYYSITKEAEQVDHIIPIPSPSHDLYNNVRYSTDNLMSVCTACHIQITAQQRGMNIKVDLSEDYIDEIKEKKRRVQRAISEDGYYI